jgi:hypothetical protein
VIRRAPAAASGLFALIALALAAGSARAQSEVFARDTFSGVVDLRAAVSNGEGSWTEGGFGRSRFGGDAGHVTAQADLVWKPQFPWDFSAVVDLQAQPGQTRGVDVGEAFLRFKPVPRGDTRFNVRAGLFYPDISREHDGPAWTVTDTITPSAINSWVGEELKVVGLEGTVTQAFDAQEVWATGGVFYYADTAGTLLALRGWSLSDLKSSANGHFDLPPLSPFMAGKQPRFTTPVHEIDNRPGWYGQLGWRRHGFAIDVTRFDNGGDRRSADAHLEWAWDTRFWNLGLTWDLDDRTSLRAQAMRGQSDMGFSTPKIWIDTGFNAAYGLFTRRYGDDALSLRGDWFEVTDHTWKAADPNREWGWALTAAWRHALTPNADLRLELLQVRTYGEARERLGLDEHQDQTVAQTALRLKF